MNFLSENSSVIIVAFTAIVSLAGIIAALIKISNDWKDALSKIVDDPRVEQNADRLYNSVPEGYAKEQIAAAKEMAEVFLTAVESVTHRMADFLDRIDGVEPVILEVDESESESRHVVDLRDDMLNFLDQND